MSPQTARTHVKAAERHGLAPLPQTKNRRRENTSSDPEAARRFAQIIGAVAGQDGTFDMKVFLEAMQMAGVKPQLAIALGRRIQMNYGPVMEEMKKMSVAELITEIDKKKQLLLSRIDEVSVIGMSAKDLALAFGILTDKALLLGGRPTSIVDFNLRAQLTVLMPQMLSEARRRGLTLEGEFSHVDTRAGDQEKALAPLDPVASPALGT
jgi:hypothetical protein